MPSANTFSIRRDLAGHRVELTAERIDRLELFAVTVRVDGQLWDTQQSDNVLGDAPEIFEQTFLELAGPESRENTN